MVESGLPRGHRNEVQGTAVLGGKWLKLGYLSIWKIDSSHGSKKVGRQRCANAQSNHIVSKLHFHSRPGYR